MVFDAPSGHLFENGDKVFTFLSQGVLDARWRFGEAPFGNNSLQLKVIESLGQGTRIDETNRFFELAKALWPAGEVTQDQSGPFVADYLHGGRDAADFWFQGL